MSSYKNDSVINLPIALIQEPTHAVRTLLNEEKMEELKESISSLGIIQPLVVKQDEESFKVIAGHRRFIAATMLKLPFVPCIIKEADEEKVLALKINENYGREDINPIDEGSFFYELLSSEKYNMESLCRIVKKSPAYINKRLSVKNLEEDVKSAMIDGKISMSVALELNKIDNPQERDRLIRFAYANGCSARTASMWRSQWELTKTAIDENQKAPPINQEGTLSGPLLWNCFLCDIAKPPTETYTLAVCTDCRNVLIKSKNQQTES